MGFFQLILDKLDRLKVAIGYTQPKESSKFFKLIAFVVFIMAICFVIYLFKDAILGGITIEPSAKDTIFVLPKTPEIEEKNEPEKITKESVQKTEKSIPKTPKVQKFTVTLVDSETGETLDTVQVEKKDTLHDFKIKGYQLERFEITKNCTIELQKINDPNL